MVIQSDGEMPLESKLHFEVKSHETQIASQDNANKTKRKKRKCSESMQNSQLPFGDETAEHQKKLPQIDKSDLDELRSVYKKCKAVVKKLERKYGYLLNDDESSTSSTHNDDEKCSCVLNKKTIFDDEGQELSKEPELYSHICPKKLKFKHSETKIIEIEYDTPDTLPEDIQNLSNILHDENLDVSYRQRVIDKMKIMKQDYINEIKFNKPALIEQLKVNPDDVFNFKGTNFSILSGYV